MSLKYNCSNCGVEIITKYLRSGDTLFCPKCKVLVEVPADAIESDSESSIRKTLHPVSSVPTVLDSESPSAEQLPPGPTPWGLASIFKFIGAYIVSMLFLSCFIGFIIALLGGLQSTGHEVDIGPNLELFGDAQNRIMDIWMMFFSIVIPILLVYYFVVKRHYNNFFEALHLKPLTKAEVLRYIKIGGGYTGAIVGLLILIDLTSLKELIPEDLPITEYFKKGRFEAITFAIRSLLAPLPEELVFRGYLYQGLKNRFGLKVSAVIVSIVFTLIHGFQLAFSPVPLLFIGFLSALLLYIRIKTDSLSKCIVVHFIYNMILVSIFLVVILLFGFEAYKID